MMSAPLFFSSVTCNEEAELQGELLSLSGASSIQFKQVSNFSFLSSFFFLLHLAHMFCSFKGNIRQIHFPFLEMCS